MSIAEKLIYVKKLRHMTSAEIARLSGVPIGTLNKIFSGQTKNPAVNPIEKIARVLQIPIQYLLDDELPVECDIPTYLEDHCVLFLSREEVHLLVEFRGLDTRGRHSIQLMTELLSAPPLHVASGCPTKRIFCYLSANLNRSVKQREDNFFKPLLLPETDSAVREADFAVLLSDGSMEPLYPPGSFLLCKWADVPRQAYGVFLYRQQVLVRRFSHRRGIKKLVSPNLNFKDIVIQPDETLKTLGTVLGVTHVCRLG